MEKRLTQLQLLRQERRPLVALAGLAFTLRLCLLVLASALSPQAAAADGLTSLCQTSSAGHGVPAPHDPLHCQCTLNCPHGCKLGPGLSALTTPPELSAMDIAAAEPHTGSQDTRLLRDRIAAIRAPPVSLI